MPISEASLFCKKHKNHPSCKKPVEIIQKPVVITKPDPGADLIKLDGKCDVHCIGDAYSVDNVCGYSNDGDFKVFRSKCHLNKFNCENTQSKINYITSKHLVYS